MKKTKFFMAFFAIVACATILSVRAISYSNEAMFANIEALSNDEANVDFEYQTAYEYEEMSLVTRQWSVPKSGFCNKVKASESVTGTCWEIVVRPAK